MESKSSQFLKAYQNIKFQENASDCFSLASTKRKTLALNFYASIQLNESNDVTDFLLNQDLDEYAKIVDDKGTDKVNNYANYVLALLSNYQNDDRRNWKSLLSEFNIREHLKPLPCSGDINCANSKLTIKDAKNLKLALNQYNQGCDTKTVEKPNISFNQSSLQRHNSFEDSLPGPKNSRTTISQNEEKTDENLKPTKCFFRTAKEELEIQKAKKNNERYGNSNLNYGAVKKSLGARKGGGVYSKFKPPIRSKETNEDEPSSSNSMDVDEVVDERLKNIDPAMIELIKNEIMDSGPKIGWDDIAGLHLAKSTIQEIVVWPMLRPDIFTGLRRPPKGILLFGPPGTGKTLIGKCIASQSNSTFFSISASSLTSKWIGDSEKMVRTLFAVAKVHQPSVVFIDEIDSLLSQRSDSEHECSRRIKTEFLVQLDGAGTGDEDRILIIGATNRPQELDEAARRRLVKRLYIPLPDEEARKQIIENLISTERHCLTKSEIEGIAKLTKGYSGADVKNLCQEASLGPIRSITPSMIKSINPEDVRPLNAKDFESALCRIKSSVSENDLDVYVEWDKKYGCGSAVHQLP